MSAAILKTDYPHIVKTPGTMGGEPRLDGHRIRVRDIAAMRDVHGHSPEQIVELDYPHVSLAQVYAALAYYEDHREEIEDFARQEADAVEQFRREHPDRVVDLRPGNRAE
jgi:uncharacterized protein (DUF433 family)